MSNDTLATRENLYVKRSISNKRNHSESSAEDMRRNDLPEAESDKRKQIRCSERVPQHARRYIGSILSFNKQIISDIIDILIRIAIVLIFIKLEVTSAFKREIHQEELWLYKNPRKPDLVTPLELLAIVVLGPFLITILNYLYTKDIQDFRAASWAWTLGLCMNGLPTSLLKITVGRPRPDFYFRCFPDGVMVLNNNTNTINLDFNCTGKPSDIHEGRKSFPSGHSSFAFASFGFIALYIGAKLHAFNDRGRGHTWRLCVALVPMFTATLIAVSRTCDYHHHWQDVIVGALIGLIAGYVSYRQYYPSIFSLNCDRPIIRWPQHSSNNYDVLKYEIDVDIGDCNEEAEQQPLKQSNQKVQTKWY